MSFGRTQQIVMHLLAGGSKPISRIVHDWPGLTESSVRSAIDSLSRRGLVDLADRHHERGRVFQLTPKGAEAEKTLAGITDDDA